MLFKIVISILFLHVAFAQEQFQVLFIKGSAKVFQLGNNDKFSESKLSVKQKITTPFRIETAAKSLVLIKSATKTNKIDENSKIDFMDSQNESVVDIKQGTFLSSFNNPKKNSKSKLKIKSRTASMGVRGTTFMFYADKANKKNFLAVNEGIVSYRGENSKEEINVSMNNSITVNEKLQNLSPGQYEFQNYINWSLTETDAQLSQPQELYKSFEKIWSEHKKEQEFLWKNRNEDMNKKWKSMSKN